MVKTTFLILEAKSFYNAYTALEQLHQSCDDPMAYYAPMVVNGAFSAEITIKAILAQNQIDYGKEHNLAVLFLLLPETFQLELLGNLYAKAPEYKNTSVLVEELILVSNAFVDWRYAFESKPAPAINTRFLAALANAAICTMYAHYNVSLVKDTTTTEIDPEIEEKFRQNRESCKKTNLALIQKKIKELQHETPIQTSEIPG